MTAMNLDGLFLNDAETPSDKTAVAGYRKEVETDAEIVYLASDISAENVAWLREHAGKTVCLRDREGGKVFGVLADISQPDGSTVESETRIAARKVPFSEAV